MRAILATLSICACAFALCLKVDVYIGYMLYVGMYSMWCECMHTCMYVCIYTCTIESVKASPSGTLSSVL